MKKYNRLKGWWDTMEIRKDFQELDTPTLTEKYEITRSYVCKLRRFMRETPEGAMNTPAAETALKIEGRLSVK